MLVLSIVVGGGFVSFFLLRLQTVVGAGVLGQLGATSANNNRKIKKKKMKGQRNERAHS
jgi:hypothetical protein